jgi:uncharacterized membrane protein
VLFALRHPGSPRGWVDGSLVFGTPLATLGLQWSMVHERPFAMAYTALGMAALYLGLTYFMKRRAPERLAALGEAFLPIGAGFVTLAIPYGFDNHNLTGAAWALEGAGLYWIGARQKRWLSRLAGVALQFLAGGALLIDPVRPESSWPVLNTWVLAGLLLGLSSLCVAYLAHGARAQLPNEWRWVQVLIPWGLFFMVGVGMEEIDDWASEQLQPGVETESRSRGSRSSAWGSSSARASSASVPDAIRGSPCGRSCYFSSGNITSTSTSPRSSAVVTSAGRCTLPRCC